ncbi:probable serine/threonine-protein kinase pakC at C-terminar half [Coccomyxa sp. Obi]|nr:probable serine/threonine-protein kinase pakC at C-terminar half [Coccomyxa sp. Obi]
MSGFATGIDSSPATISRSFLGTAPERRMYQSEQPRAGLTRTINKEGHQQDESTTCRRVVEQLVKKIAEKDAVIAGKDAKIAGKDAEIAEKDAQYTHLQQENAALEERGLSHLVAKMMAQASFRASEELRTEEKAAADAAARRLRIEKEQVRDIGLQLGKKLNTALEESTALRAGLEERVAQLQAAQENYTALLQQCQQMQLKHLAQVYGMRQAHAAQLRAAGKEAALREQQMAEEAQQREEETQEEVAELKKEVAKLKEEVAEMKEEVAELKEEVQELKEEVAEVVEQKEAQMAHIEDLRKWGEDAMADIKQLEAWLRRASQLPVMPLAESPLVAHAGKGAQSSVDLHLINGTLIAVKKPECEDDERALLLEEQALAHMDHSAIPKPLAWLAIDDGRLALGLPALTGGSLRDLLEAQQCSGKAEIRLSVVEGMSLIDQGAEALQYVHSSGYVHSDIKPDNLMLDAEGRLAIIDWGSTFLSSERQQTWGGTVGYVRPVAAASTENMGPGDDIRGLCGVGLEIATGQCIAELLRTQYDCLYSSDESFSREELAEKEEAKERITEFCESRSGLDPLDFMDRMLVAEYLGYINIKEEDFEPYLNEEGAPQEYLQLMLRAVSRPVGCGEAPMPTLQEIRDAISSFFAESAGPSSEATVA